MKKPQTIKFTDLEISPLDLDTSMGGPGIIPGSWTRVQFSVPNDWHKLEQVSKWLMNHAADDWATYNYHADNKAQERTMVVKFKDKSDALMFKLRGGHQCWQDDT